MKKLSVPMLLVVFAPATAPVNGWVAFMLMPCIGCPCIGCSLTCTRVQTAVGYDATLMYNSHVQCMAVGGGCSTQCGRAAWQVIRRRYAPFCFKIACNAPACP